MSMQHPNILYVGNTHRAQALQQVVESDGWHVYQPIKMMEALAFYVFYAPDVVIVDFTPGGKFPEAQLIETYKHFASVNAERLFVISSDNDEFEHPVINASDPEHIIDYIHYLFEEVPSYC